MEKTYTIIVHVEEDGYWGECKEIEGCFAQAKTIEELKKLMAEAIYMHFSDNEEVGQKETKDIKLEVSYA